MDEQYYWDVKRKQHSEYTLKDFSYIHLDMLFPRQSTYLSPQKYSELDSDDKSIVTDNRFVGYPNKNAMFDTFAKKFNEYFATHGNWKIMGYYEGQIELLQFTNVSGRMGRDVENETSRYAYSAVSKIGDNDLELTYRYKIAPKETVYKLEDWKNNWGDSDIGFSQERKFANHINDLNADKYLRGFVQKFLEHEKNVVINRYYGNDKNNFMHPEFDDVHRTHDSYGLMFFVETTKYNDEIDEFPPLNIGTITIGEYDIGDTTGNRTIDPLDPDNTTVWFSPFDIVEVSTYEHASEEFLEIKVIVPEGIAFNNEAKVFQVNTLGQTGGATVTVPDEKDEYLRKTYEIDGLIQNGLPNKFVARAKMTGTQPYWKMAIGRTLSIIGNDVWKDEQPIGSADKPIQVDTNGRYQPVHPYKGDNQERRYLPANLATKKFETNSVGSLNRMKYRFLSGMGIKWDRYAYSFDPDLKLPLAVVQRKKTSFSFIETPYPTFPGVNIPSMSGKKIKLNLTDNKLAVTMKPKTPIYYHFVTGFQGDPTVKYRTKFNDKAQQFTEIYKSTNPDWNITTQGGRVLDIANMQDGYNSVLKPDDYIRVKYDSVKLLNKGYIEAIEDVPFTLWVYQGGMNYNATRKNDRFDDRLNYPYNPGAGAQDWYYSDWEYNGLFAAPHTDMRYKVNSGAWHSIRNFNAPQTRKNSVNLKKGDKIYFEGTNASVGMPSVFNLGRNSPDYVKMYNPNNKIQTFPRYSVLVGGSAWDNVEVLGALGDLKSPMSIQDAIPLIDGKKTLYGGNSNDGNNSNLVEVADGKLDLSTVPVKLGVVAREIKHL